MRLQEPSAAGYCNQCGTKLKEPSAAKDEDGRTKLYADIAHPINSPCREMIQQKVIEAFAEEKARAKLPGYVPSYDDFDSVEAGPPPRAPPLRRPTSRRPKDLAVRTNRPSLNLGPGRGPTLVLGRGFSIDPLTP